MLVVVIMPYGGRPRPTEMFGFTRILASLSRPAKPSHKVTASRSDLRGSATLTTETTMAVLPIRSLEQSAPSLRGSVLPQRFSDSLAFREEEGSETVAPRHGGSGRSCRQGPHVSDRCT